MTTYTSSARYTLQVPGTNNNSWGSILNSGVFQLVDDNVNGRVAFALSGARSLTSVLGATDEARNAIIDVTGGSGGTITIPSVSKPYLVRNGSGGTVSITTGGITNASIYPGEVVPVFTDASAVYRVVITNMQGNVLTNLGNPIAPQDAATKAYVDLTAFDANAGIFPGQGGNANKITGTDGTNIFWTGLLAGTGLARTGAVGSGGALTFALDINSLTEDAAPDVAADFLLSYDTSASAHKKVRPQNLPTQAKLISTTAGSGATISLTSIPQIYNELIILVEDVTFSGAPTSVQFSVSTNNGSGYASPTTLISSPSTHTSMVLRIPLYTKGFAGLQISAASQVGAFSSPSITALTATNALIMATGGINAVQFTLAGGSSPAFSAGNILLYGV